MFICIYYSFGRAMSMNCTNALTPDMYGHYRVAKITQTKHHWFWKVRCYITIALYGKDMCAYMNIYVYIYTISLLMNITLS